MEVISIINYKGGVGKTTVTANLAGELARRGKRVLLLDMDPQASLTFFFVSPSYWKDKLEREHTIKNYFDNIIEGNNNNSLSGLKIQLNYYRFPNGGFINLIPSHLGLINIDLELATMLGGANINQSKLNFIRVHGQLRDAIWAYNGSYDVVLIDCPPNFNIVTKNALVASNRILIPTKPDYLSTLGIDYLIRSIGNLINDFNDYSNLDLNIENMSLDLLGIVFTMVQFRNQAPIQAQQQYMEQVSKLRSSMPIFNSVFRENKTIFSNAPENGIPVILNKYRDITYTNIVNELQRFVDEFQQRTGI